MDCKSCKSLEPVVGGDTIVYFCHAFKIFIDRSALFLIGRFCVEYKEVKND